MTDLKTALSAFNLSDAGSDDGKDAFQLLETLEIPLSKGLNADVTRVYIS
jgi:hypothetical protein